MDEPQVISASEWGAAPPRSPLAPRGPLAHLVLHHTAFATGRIGGASLAAEARHMREIQRWHLERGWATIGYHFVVSPSGRVFRGRPVDRLGAHVQGHNRGTVGICLMGDFERERPTGPALETLGYVRRTLVPGGDRVPIVGHSDHSGHATNACPGRHLRPYLRRTRTAGSRLAAAPGEQRRSNA